ncbi:restriction endonuclease subunit S [uncultured Chryseobacterium sp.]|uniref:restriction endonuclease subunit S n=1 Tax=uncultured Chryseobacterium sp. TaxID=259322 RepID=UPI0025F81106|nr:restriction endonuclease subunit S [uncultured Chryseobacterium sp.]
MRGDWIKCEIGEVFDVVTGNTPSKANPLLYGGNIPFIKPPEINNKEVEDASEFLTEEGAAVARILPKCSVLITCIGNLGRVAMNSKFEVAFNQQINALKPNKFVYPKYIFYEAQSSNFRNQLEELSTAVTVALVNKTNFSKVKFPLPPLPEQRAIVKKLESLFSSLDAGVADLKKAQQQLKIYRQAVLKKAFEGIAETIILDDAGAWKGGGTPSTQNKDFWENGDICWVSSQDVKTKYIEETERKITRVAIENSSTKWIKKNALLFVVRSGILRRIFPIAIAKVDLCVNQDIQTLTLNEKYLTEFVYWYLIGNEYDIRHNCAKDGTTVESIDVSKLKKYKLPTCTLDQQKKIVKHIESRLSVCDSIGQNIKESLEKAEALHQSILKKAFEGNLLTAQELAECKMAEDYEPADVLLEKIKAEQTELKTKPAKKKAV